MQVRFFCMHPANRVSSSSLATSDPPVSQASRTVNAFSFILLLCTDFVRITRIPDSLRDIFCAECPSSPPLARLANEKLDCFPRSENFHLTVKLPSSREELDSSMRLCWYSAQSFCVCALDSLLTCGSLTRVMVCGAVWPNVTGSPEL